MKNIYDDTSIGEDYEIIAVHYEDDDVAVVNVGSIEEPIKVLLYKDTKEVASRNFDYYFYE